MAVRKASLAPAPVHRSAHRHREIERRAAGLIERVPSQDGERVQVAVNNVLRGWLTLAAYSGRPAFTEALGSSRYGNILSRDGQAQLDEVVALVQGTGSIRLEAVERLAEGLPSVTDPRLHFFVDPFSAQILEDSSFGRFMRFLHREEGSSIRQREYGEAKIASFNIELSSGCRNTCLMCSESARAGNLGHIPFPMALKLLEQLGGERRYFENGILLYGGSDVFQWRDVFFGADFGHLAQQIKKRKINIGTERFVSHGFWPNDAYANRAARYLLEVGDEKDRAGWELTIHLFHPEIFLSPESAPNKKMLEKYAKKFAHDIKVGQPRTIRLLAHDRNPRNLHFTHEYLRTWYADEVLSRLRGKIRKRYTLDAEVRISETRSYKVVGETSVDKDGRAVGSPYFFPEDTLTDYRSNPSPNFSATVSADGQILVAWSPSSGLTLPIDSPSQTVGELYPDANSPAFTNFLRKLHFLVKYEIAEIERERAEKIKRDGFHAWGSSSEEPTVMRPTRMTDLIFWDTFYEEVNLNEWLGWLPQEEGLLALSTDALPRLHARLAHLPVVGGELYCDKLVGDIPRDRFGFGWRLDASRGYDNRFGFYYPMLLEEEGAASTSLRERSFLGSFPEGRQAIQAIRQMQEEGQTYEEQCAAAFALLSDFPVAVPYFYLKDLVLPRTRTTLPFRAMTGLK